MLLEIPKHSIESLYLPVPQQTFSLSLRIVCSGVHVECAFCEDIFCIDENDVAELTI